MVAGLVGLVLGLLAAAVVTGMALGLDRTFDKGTASVESMILQEVCGGLTLASLAFALGRVRRLWHGTVDWQVPIAGLAVVACGALWLFARALEYSS